MKTYVEYVYEIKMWLKWDDEQLHGLRLGMKFGLLDSKPDAFKSIRMILFGHAPVAWVDGVME